MQNTFNIERESALPFYSQLVMQLEHKIKSGECVPGEQFYSEQALVGLTGLSRPTIRQAVSELVRKGVLVKERGRGTFVRTSGKNAIITAANDAKVKYKRIGLIMPWLANTYFSPLLEAVEDVAYRAGFNVVLVNNRDDEQCEMSRIRELLDNGVDGLIWMCSTGGPNIAFARRILHKLPVVAVDRTFVSSGQSVSIVESDNINGLKQAVKYLVNKGRRRIAYIGARSKLDSVIQREEGYRAGLLECGIAPAEDWIFRGRSDLHTNGICGVEKILKSGIDFDAICCVTDDTAAGAIERLLEANIKIPEDVAVIGFNNEKIICHTTRPTLTSVSQDIKLMGRKAAELLVAKLHGDEKIERIVIPVTIVERESA